MIRKRLFRYLAGLYFRNLLAISTGLLSVIYLLDVVELSRRASKREGVPFSAVLEMGVLKLPEVGLTALPFFVLFAALFTFWQLSRRHELVVIRAAGFSVWQLIAPLVFLAALIGASHTTLLNPLGASSLQTYSDMEARHLEQRRSEIALMREGLWLRQVGDDHEYTIIHAKDIDQPDWQMQDVLALFFSADNRFERRIDAERAEIKDGMWYFYQAASYRPAEERVRHSLLTFPTQLTPKEIEESFADPQTVSFWRLPDFIETVSLAGFDTRALRVHYQALWTQPFLLMAMVLLAAATAMRPHRQGYVLMMMTSGVAIGFLLFFTDSFLQALGISGQIPVFLATWSAPFVFLCLGSAALLFSEDG